MTPDAPSTPPEAGSGERSRIVTSRGRFLETHLIRWVGPDGVERQWESAERVDDAGAVLVIPRVKGTDEYIVVRQYRPPARGMVWEFPAGLVEPGEAPEAAARRELREETGYHGEITALWPPSFTTPGMTGEAVSVAMARVDPDAPENRDLRQDPDPGEFIEVRRLAEKDALERLREAARAGDLCDIKLLAYFLGRRGAEGEGFR